MVGHNHCIAEKFFMEQGIAQNRISLHTYSRYSFDTLIRDNKVGVVTVDMSSIGIKFKNFMQVGCRDLGSKRGHTVYCRKPIILPKVVRFFGTFLELPVLPSIICGAYMIL